VPLPDPKSAPESSFLGGSLTWVAGFVDAVGYLALSHIYAANMSGNSVALAIDSARANWRQAFTHGCPLLAFLPGLIAGAMLVGFCRRAGVKAALSPALLVEAALLTMFLLVFDLARPNHPSLTLANGWRFIFTVTLLAFAMGFQNGALRQIGSLSDIHTYVTGTMLAAANGLVQYLFWLARRLRVRRPDIRRVARYSLHHRSLHRAAYAISLWTLYIIGAILGALSLIHFGVGVIAVPIAFLLFNAVINWFLPVPLSAKP
jgi:uncharacterized membrane protein YoaK (UPF0700 family)